MRFVRVWLPVAVVVAGVIAFALHPNADGLEGAAGIVGAGLAIWLLNLLFRIGMRGEQDRDAEDEARAFFDQHGYWPDEAPPETPPEHKHPASHPHRARPMPRRRG